MLINAVPVEGINHLKIRSLIMESMNYSNARAQLSMLMEKAIGGQPVEITRRGKGSAVIISKDSYEAYKKAEFEAMFPPESKNLKK